MTDHLDERGQVCTRHVTSLDKLLDYALVGSRATGFHHDAASKLQSLMMALDEIGELIGEDPSDLRVALDTAHLSLRELHVLLTANRALAKPPLRKPVAIGDVLKLAALRAGVKVGAVSGPDAAVSELAWTHALALLLDLVAGPPSGGRVVAVTIDTARISLAGASPTHANTNELIAIAAHAIARDQGTLRCTPTGFVVQLP